MEVTSTREGDRIESLDVLRGFALLGILLLNILGFGLVSAAFLDPGIYIDPYEGIDFLVWALIELTSEGLCEPFSRFCLAQASFCLYLDLGTKVVGSITGGLFGCCCLG